MTYGSTAFCWLVGDDDIGSSSVRDESGAEKAQLLDFEEGLEAGGFQKGVRKLLGVRGGGVQDAGIVKGVLHSVDPNFVTYQSAAAHLVDDASYLVVQVCCL